LLKEGPDRRETPEILAKMIITAVKNLYKVTKETFGVGAGGVWSRKEKKLIHEGVGGGNCGNKFEKKKSVLKGGSTRNGGGA